MANTEQNMQDIKDLAYLYDTVLKHLQLLTDYTKTNEDCYKHKDEIIGLNKSHEDTRNKGRVILSKDLTKLSNNFFFKMIAKDLAPTSIQFINLITDFTQEMVDFIEKDDLTNDKIKISELRVKISDLNNLAQSQFKGLKDKLLKLG